MNIAFTTESFRRSVGQIVTGAATLGLAAIIGAGSPATTSASVAPAPRPAPVAAKIVTRPADDASGMGYWLHGSENADSLEGSDHADILHAYQGDDTLRGFAGDDHMVGFEGNDVLVGGSGDDELDGCEGDDTLAGGSGHDRLEGGAGNDRLEGGAGDDRYVFAAGFGQDVVRERARSGGFDRIVLEGLSSDDARFSRAGDDLIIRAESGDQITVVGQFAGESSRIESIEFADGPMDLVAALEGAPVRLALR